MFKIFYLYGCGYSEKALELMHKYNLVNKLNEIECTNSDVFSFDPDLNFIPSDYQTYPKILYIDKKNNKKIFIGGYTELDKLINLATTPAILECNKVPAQKYIEKNSTCKILIKLTKLIKET
jgi:hypothetical protein